METLLLGAMSALVAASVMTQTELRAERKQRARLEGAIERINEALQGTIEWLDPDGSTREKIKQEERNAK